MARDDRRLGAEDRATATALHGRRAARLRADGQALSELVDRVLAGYRAFNRGDFDAALASAHPDAEWVVFDFLPDTGPFRGPEGLRRFWESWRESFPDFQAVPDSYVETEDSIVVMTSVQGSGRDSGVAVDTPSFPMIWTVRDGLLVRVEMFPSTEAALEAVGLPAETPFRRF